MKTWLIRGQRQDQRQGQHQSLCLDGLRSQTATNTIQFTAKTEADERVDGHLPNLDFGGWRVSRCVGEARGAPCCACNLWWDQGRLAFLSRRLVPCAEEIRTTVSSTSNCLVSRAECWLHDLLIVKCWCDVEARSPILPTGRWVGLRAKA